uniref:AP complex subunit sigma n=1 Tax=Ditylum brightwellii TaxID=49249 RepID=A0A7S4W4M2_9STRA|mmetsp:Transcript_30016/g.39913  ORF Transcript_30016/g.39913 Transcript_30016/m.39913 type:complete len:174 (+) Transcript_30016:407-928(+)
MIFWCVCVCLHYKRLCSFENRNKQGQTRLSSYYEWLNMDERVALESEIIRKCLSRSELQCSFVEYRGFKVIYRRYASLFFIVGTKADVIAGGGAENNENELGLLEFIHTLVETMDKWAGSICELDIMYQLEQVHFLLDEMVMNGYVLDTNKSNILRPLDLIERESKKGDGVFR